MQVFPNSKLPPRSWL